MGLERGHGWWLGVGVVICGRRAPRGGWARGPGAWATVTSTVRRRRRARRRRRRVRVGGDRGEPTRKPDVTAVAPVRSGRLRPRPWSPRRSGAGASGPPASRCGAAGDVRGYPVGGRWWRSGLPLSGGDRYTSDAAPARTGGRGGGESGGRAPRAHRAAEAAPYSHRSCPGEVGAGDPRDRGPPGRWSGRRAEPREVGAGGSITAESVTVVLPLLVPTEVMLTGIGYVPEAA